MTNFSNIIFHFEYNNLSNLLRIKLANCQKSAHFHHPFSNNSKFIWFPKYHKILSFQFFNTFFEKCPFKKKNNAFGDIKQHESVFWNQQTHWKTSKKRVILRLFWYYSKITQSPLTRKLKKVSESEFRVWNHSLRHLSTLLQPKGRKTKVVVIL